MRGVGLRAAAPRGSATSMADSTTGQADSASQPPPPLPVPFEPATPPPLPSAAVTSGPFYQPPVFFRTEEPQRAGEPQWVLWGMFVFIALMVGGGLVAFVATRNGPARASARTTASTVQPRPVTRAAAPPRVTSPAPLPPAPARRPAPTAGFPLVALPRLREADLQLKKIWQAANAAGAQTRTIRTLKSVAAPDATIQPVQIELACQFPQAVEFLQGLRSAAPTAILDSMDATVVSTESGAATSVGTVRVVLTLDCYFADETTADTTRSLCPHPDVAGALVDVSNLTEGKFRFTRVAVKVDDATAALQRRVRPMVTVEGLAQSDVEVASYMSRLNSSRRFTDVNLVMCDTATVDGATYRKFTIEVRPRNTGGDTSPGTTSVPDIFQAALPQAAPRPKPPAPPELSPAEAQRRLGQLGLESVTLGRSPACVINGRLYRTGHVVNGLTIEQITADGIVVRGGGQRFELKLPKS